MHHIVIFKDMRILQKNVLFFFMVFSYLEITKIWKRSLFSCNGNYVINFRYFFEFKKWTFATCRADANFNSCLNIKFIIWFAFIKIQKYIYLYYHIKTWFQHEIILKLKSFVICASVCTRLRKIASNFHVQNLPCHSYNETTLE